MGFFGRNATTVGLVAGDTLKVTLPGGMAPELAAKIVYQGPLKAPIKAGQHIADGIIDRHG